MSDESLCSRLTVTRLVTVVSLVTILHGLLSHIQEVHTLTVDSSGETERHNSGIVDFPASHRLEAARPPTNLPPTNLLRGYLGRSAPPARARRRARSRAAQISPPARRPAAAPACGGLIIR